MLNHSLEHMQDQTKVLSHVHTLLNPSGVCIIRIPTVSSYLWDKYREYWFGLDAPRHLFLHSTNSIVYICRKCGFSIRELVYDSLIDLGNVRSRLYSKGWNLKKQDKFLYSPLGALFIVKHIVMAKWLNHKKRGNSIMLYLEKSRDSALQ